MSDLHTNNMRLKKTYPICFISKDVLLMYKYGSFLLYDIVKQNVLKKRELISTFKECWLARLDVLYRLLRLGVRQGVYIGNDTVLVVIEKTLYEVNIKTLDISSGFNFDKGYPLNFGVSNGIEGFDDGVYCGDYIGMNPNMEKVNIYKRDSKGQWNVVFSFPEGEINHVHNVVPDKFRNCFWIFTGDFDHASAIWKATNNFKDVKPIRRGNQLYRGCVAFPLKEGLLYATDAPFAQDFIILMKEKENGLYEFERISEIDGSCIYGTQLNEKTIVFQSSVETDGRNESMFNLLFSRKRGAGIKDKYIHLYAGNLKKGFLEVYKAEKDNWPYELFQYGTFQFPSGTNEGNLLPFYTMAAKQFNLETQIINLEQT